MARAPETLWVSFRRSMPEERSTWSALSVPVFTPAILPGARPVSMNHLVLSRVPPENVSWNVGVADPGWSSDEPELCANVTAPRDNTTRRMRRNMCMGLVFFPGPKDGLLGATKQNVPDSLESWDARRTSPPPKDCSRTSYPQRGRLGMARMGYVHTLVLRRSSGFFGNQGAVTSATQLSLQRCSPPPAGPA
jgi:hypothetical protein